MNYFSYIYLHRKAIMASLYFCVFLNLNNITQAQSLSTDKNAIVHSKFRVATTNETDANDPTKAIINIQYIDGLGRPLQTVGYQQSPTQKDIISGATGYDRYGRNSLSVLPVPASSGTGNYQSSIVTLGQGFYGDTRPYSSVLLYERSSSGREREIMGPGQAWQTNDKKSQVFDEITGSDARLYKLDGSNNIVKTGFYPSNSLYKKRIIDEQGHISIEIRDKLGRLVQKQTQDETGYIITYYIYDGLNRVRVILQPKGYELDQTINYNSTEWNNWVFFYVYDNRSRVIEKKVPGADAEWMVYDKWDRLVWQQSALQREQGKWTFMKYDSFNRLVMSGEKSESRNRAALQAEANNWTGDRYESRVTGGDIYYSYSNTYPQIFNPAEIKLVSYFDDYDNWRPNDMLFDGANAYHLQQSSTIGFATGGRSRNSENGNWLVSVNYYDNKKRLIQTFSHNLYGQVERTDYKYNFAGEAIEIRYLMRDVSNVATIQLERFDYDNVGRKTAYKLGMNAVGETIATYEYDEIGRLKTKKIYPDQTFTTGGALDYINRPPSPNANIDDVARKAINLNEGTVIDAATITKYSAMIDPNAAGGTNIQGLQTIDYTYHIRGGVRGINLDGAGNPTPDVAQGDLFSYKLDYETAGFYDGNIGKQTWQSVENNSPLGIRSYTYNYDPVSRLKSATYSGINGEDYSLPNLSYDKNGNITNLQRKGKNGSSFSDIDNLSYAYTGNRLATVTDGILGDHTIDLVPRGSGNYTYYTDGSLKSDENEQIANITYDTYLKQPTEINLTDGRWIKYYYSGSGGLLKTLYSTNESWEYGGKLIYKNGIRYQISQQEGRLIYETNDWKLEFQYNDHLGNNRVSFRANGTQLEKLSDTSFDPWGVVLNGINQINGFQNRLEFQGKEKESTFNLNRINLGARTINPTIGRFDRVDPLSENHFNMSSYHYVLNNPISFIDPFGLDTALYKLNDGGLVDTKKSNSKKTPIWVVDETSKNYDPKNPWKTAKPLTYKVGENTPLKGVSGTTFRSNHPLRNKGAKAGSQVYREDLLDLTSEFYNLTINGIADFENKDLGYNEFRKLVTDDGKWDLKSRIVTDGTPSYAAVVIGEWSLHHGSLRRYDDYGNISYGVFGTKGGFSSKDLLRGSNINQIWKDLFGSTNGSGDENRDVLMMEAGIKWANKIK